MDWDKMTFMPRPGDRWALFLDLDGTLLDLAPRPDLVATPSGLVELLQALELGLDGAVAVVSGRPLQQVDALLQPWRPLGAGEHGAFCRLSPDVVVTPDPPAVPATWRQSADRFALSHRGIVVEQKATAIAVHFRFAPAIGALVHDVLAALVAEDSMEFMLVPAHMAWEIRPRGINKGTAVRRLMLAAPFAGRKPVFVGDDVTDEDGMDAAEALGGMGVRVQDRFPSGASGVRAWLSDLSTFLAARVA